MRLNNLFSRKQEHFEQFITSNCTKLIYVIHNFIIQMLDENIQFYQ